MNSLVEDLITEGERAIAKMKREYKRLQPDADKDECWAEVEQFENVLEEFKLVMENKGEIRVRGRHL